MEYDAHLMFISAQVSRLIIPGFSAYAASKAALESYAAFAEKELRPRKITLVRPSAVDTKFWNKVPFSPPTSALNPDFVANRILSSYRQGLSGLLDIDTQE